MAAVECKIPVTYDKYKLFHSEVRHKEGTELCPHVCSSLQL
jgi:hypothetical protein